MKLAIIGSRTFEDYNAALKSFNKHFPNGVIDEIVSGGAKGADTIAKTLASQLGLKYTEFKPDWEKYGRGAGFKRNALIINHCDRVLAFWDGASKGTLNSIQIARDTGKEVIIELFKGTPIQKDNWENFGI